MTVENAESINYQLSAYIINDSVGAGNVTFQVMNSTGTPKTVELVELQTDGSYSNGSLADKWNATERQVSIPAHETLTASFEKWNPGMTIVYIIEDSEGRIVQTEYAECSSNTLAHTFVFSDGPENGYEATCSR
ncbi:hypothetical protein [Halonotius sp. GCM10025705]|uniref:hypothetical protein n=1 Tax=Halonotius sp. GCM10025705 TaxID=3252678 RepID=UPI00361CA617